MSFAWHNATLLEAIWFLMGIIATAVSLFNLRAALFDWKSIREADGSQWAKERFSLREYEVMRAYIRGVLEEEWIRTIKSLAMFAAGLFAVLAPPATPSPKVTPVGIAITAFVVIVGLGVTLSGILTARRRRRVVMLRRQTRFDPS